MTDVTRPRADRGSGGMVTAETATVLPFLVVVTMALAWMISLGITQVRCLDAAREAARLVARGDGTPAAVAVASQVAPSGADVSVREGHGLVDVSVAVRVVPPVPLLGDSLAVRLVASATAAAEVTSAS